MKRIRIGWGKTVKRAAWVLILGVMWAAVGTAAEVRSYVSATTVGTEDVFSLTLEVTNAEDSVSFPRVRNLPGLDILSGPSTAESLSIVNGSMSRSVTHQYQLSARKPGSVTIPSFSIRVGSQTYRTDPITIQVKQGSVVPRRRPRPRSPFDLWDDDFFSPPVHRRALTRDAVFIRTELDRRRVYVGQGVIVSYRLLASVPVGNLNIKEMPDFVGFLTEDVPQKGPVDRRSQVVNGTRYDTAVIYRRILYPTRSGELEIPPVTFSMQAGGGFSMLPGTPLERQSEPVRLHVMPLPEPIPDGFSGAVGRFSLSARADMTELKTGESLTVTVTVSGEGDFNNVLLPFPDNVPGFRLFRPPSPELRRDRTRPLRGVKEWQVVLVPQQTGELTIPSMKLVSFNPDTGAYETAVTDPIPIRVFRGETPVSVSRDQTTPVEVVGKDIGYIRTGNRPDRFVDITSRPWYRWTAAVVPVLLLLLGLFLRISDPSRRDPVAYRRQQAYARFRRELGQARKHLRKQRSREFYQGISRACVGYFADKWNRSNLDLKIDEIARELSEHDISEKDVKALVDLVEYCDFESYTPSGKGLNRAVLKDAEQIIARLEKQL